jgi:tetratricopeptide (TPR) repeat protein
MKTGIDLKKLISLMLILCGGLLFSQEETKVPLEEKLYEEYKSNGLDKAMELYENKKTAEFESLQEPLNILGYKLMMEDKDLEAAELVFKAQIKEYPEQANPYDSYGDLLLEKGEKEKAKEQFKKAAELAENIEDEEEKNQMKQASLSKLAKLENKHRQLDFLTGDWEITQTGYRDGQAMEVPASTQNVSYLPGESVLRIKHTREGNTPCCERIVAYDAMEDTYEMAFISSVNPTGIEVSDIKIKDNGNGKFEFIEDYNENDTQKKARHEITKTDNDHIQWNIYVPKEGSPDWELVSEMQFKRKA